MPTIVDYAGQAVETESELWTHGESASHLPPLDRVILDLIDRLGYSPAEVSRVLRLSISRVCGTYWRSRWSAHRVANRVAGVLRDDAEFDPRHAIVFELSAVCGYTFVEISECLGYDRGHACRIVSETAEKLRERLTEPAGDSPRFDNDGDEPTGASALRLIAALPAIDEVQTARNCRLHYARNESLTPLETITLWREMLDEGDFASQAELAAALGVSASSVRNHLRLLTLPAEWLQRVTHGELPLSHLRPLLAVKNQPEVLAALADRLQQCDRRPSYLDWCAIVNLSSLNKNDGMPSDRMMAEESKFIWNEKPRKPSRAAA